MLMKNGARTVKTCAECASGTIYYAIQMHVHVPKHRMLPVRFLYSLTVPLISILRSSLPQHGLCAVVLCQGLNSSFVPAALGSIAVCTCRGIEWMLRLELAIQDCVILPLKEPSLANLGHVLDILH